MSKRPQKKKRIGIERAAPTGYAPGGSLLYVPPGVTQSTLGQTFYGSKLNIPTGQTALFSSGQPLPPQSGVNPGGLPIQFKFPVSYNTYPPNRSLYEEMPSFEQLRRLAIMDYGITLCERYWLDMVPQMTLKIGLKQEYITQGAEEKNYQKEIGFFRDFFSQPDGQHNIHEWIQQALVEQSQIDELYIYKDRTRGGKLLGLQIVAGDQMKPLLDDWGRQPGKYAYQQYPWGIPGWQYTADQMIHKRETPQINTPYGRGRVERVLLITNTSLRKQREDLARFSENNIPAGMMEVPESLNWTPDQIDAYEQSWNALIAGNLQQLVRIKFTQPGMKYVPFVQPSFDSVIDRYWLNIRASVYGVPMDELGFTDTSNRSVGEIQQDVVYRRTIGPHAKVYATTLTDVMNHDFPPELHGEMFEVSFGGYEEQEDDQAKAATLTMYTNAGILGLTNAAKIANLPEDPGAPSIGRILPQQGGPPIFLDDVATPEMRKAQQQAAMAGFKMAANPPQQPAGGNGQQGAGDGGDEVDQAMDEADQSLGQLSRSDPVHGFHGEFGFDGGPQQHTGSGHHGGHHGHSKGGHHTKGPHLSPRDSMHQRAQKLAARFGKLENRRLGRHWSAAQSKAAGALEDIFSQISHAMAKGGQQQSIDHLLDKAFLEAKTLFSGKSKGLAAMSRALTRIDKANDGGLFRMADIDDEDGEFSDLEEVLDELEIDDDEPMSRVSEALAGIDEIRRILRAVNITGEIDEQRAQTHTEDEERSDGDFERADGSIARAGAHVAPEPVEAGGEDRAKAISQEYRRWRERAVADAKAHRAQRAFVSTLIPDEEYTPIWDALRTSLVPSVDDVRAIFERAHERDTSPKAVAASASASGGHQPASKNAWKLRW